MSLIYRLALFHPAILLSLVENDMPTECITIPGLMR